MSDIDFSAAPPGGLRPLAVFATAREALALLGRLGPRLSELALPAFLVVFLPAPLAILGGGGWAFFLLGVELFAVVWFATATLRLALLGPGQGKSGGYPRWATTEIRVFGRLLGVAGIVFAAGVPAIAIFGSLAGAFGGPIPQLGTWLIAPALIMLLATVAVIFAIPAAAVGYGYGFGQAWREAKDVLPQLTALVLLVLMPLDLLLELGAQLLLLFSSATGLVVPAIAYGIAIDLLRTAVACLLFAAAFARRRGWTLGAAPPT